MCRHTYRDIHRPCHEVCEYLGRYILLALAHIHVPADNLQPCSSAQPWHKKCTRTLSPNPAHSRTWSGSGIWAGEIPPRSGLWCNAFGIVKRWFRGYQETAGTSRKSIPNVCDEIASRCWEFCNARVFQELLRTWWLLRFKMSWTPKCFCMIVSATCIIVVPRLNSHYSGTQQQDTHRSFRYMNFRCVWIMAPCDWCMSCACLVGNVCGGWQAAGRVGCICWHHPHAALLSAHDASAHISVASVQILIFTDIRRHLWQECISNMRHFKWRGGGIRIHSFV